MKYLVMSFLAAFSININAASLYCSGTVDELAYHIPGTVYVRLSSMNKIVAVCNTQTDWVVPGESRVITPETCNMFYSTLLAAKMSQTPFSNVLFDGDQVPTSCDSWEDWRQVSIRFFRL